MFKLFKKLFIFGFLFCFSKELLAQETTALSSLLTVDHLSAQFTQTVYDGQHHVIQKTTGKMWLMRPGKFRWEVNQPSAQLLIADGNKIWFYDKSLAQVTVQPQTKANQDVRSPALLLSATPEQLSQNFSVAQLASAPNIESFKLSPKTESPFFQTIELDFINRTVSKMILTDSLGQQTVIQFSKVNVNGNLDPNLFRFVPPKGVDVITE